MILSNYHTHTFFCDGSAEPEKYIIEALKKGFTSLGFSGHAPLPFENSWSLSQVNLDTYCKTILNIKNKYKNEIEIYLSLEIDYIPGTSEKFSILQNKHDLDYTLGAIHLVKNPDSNDLWFIDGPVSNYDNGLKRIFKNDIRLGVETYFNQLNEMVMIEKPDIIAHFDKIKMNNKHRYFQESEKWYKKLLQHTLGIIAQSKSIIEVNTRGIYTGKCDSLYPGIEVLKQCFDLNIPLTISADAHKPADINSYFAETEIILKDIGYKSIRILKKNQWVDWEL